MHLYKNCKSYKNINVTVIKYLVFTFGFKFAVCLMFIKLIVIDLLVFILKLQLLFKKYSIKYGYNTRLFCIEI